MFFFSNLIITIWDWQVYFRQQTAPTPRLKNMANIFYKIVRLEKRILILFSFLAVLVVPSVARVLPTNWRNVHLVFHPSNSEKNRVKAIIKIFIHTLFLSSVGTKQRLDFFRCRNPLLTPSLIEEGKTSTKILPGHILIILFKFFSISLKVCMIA